MTPTSSFPILESVLDTYTEVVRVGDSEGLLGARFLVTITRPFTPGEDAVFAWASTKGTAALAAILALSDGRDYAVFVRVTDQTKELARGPVFSHA